MDGELVLNAVIKTYDSNKFMATEKIKKTKKLFVVLVPDTSMYDSCRLFYIDLSYNVVTTIHTI